MFRLSPSIVAQGFATTLANAWPVKVTDGVSVLGTPSNPLSVTINAGSQQSTFGPITDTQSLGLNTQESGTCCIQISGTWTGSINFQATVDGSNWDSVNGTDPLTGLHVTSTTSNGLWAIACAGFQEVRVLGGPVASGTATVFITASTASQVVNIGTTGGLATDANISTRLNTLGQKTSANSTPVVIASDQSPIPISATFSGSVTVSNFPAIQPISAVSLPLPTGAAQDSTLTGGTAKTQIFDGTNVIGTSAHPVRVDPTGVTAQPVSGSVAVTNFPVTQPISAVSLPLPPDAATDSNISSRLNTLGQNTSANSAPVVIASDQSAVPISGSVSVGNFPATQPVSGTVTADVGSTGGLALDATLTGGTQKAQIYDGTNTIGTSTHPVRTDPTGTTTQPVSGSVTVSGAATVTQGTAAALAAAWPVEVTDGTNVLGTSTHPVRTDPTGTTTQPVSGTVTATVSGSVSVSNFPVTQPVSGAVTVSGTATVTQGTAAALAAAWPVEVTDGTHTLPTGDAIARSIAVQVNDGTNVLGTTAHPEIVAGAGVAGTPAGGVVSIQGVASGTAIPVSGSVTVSGTSTVTQGTAAALAAAWPVEVTDGTNILGTSAHPVRTDPTGSTTQPVSGAVTVSGTATVTQGTAAALAAAWPVEVTDGTNILGTTTHPVQTNVTDGTHSLPTADAAARALFAKVTDGTNTQPTGDAIARSIAVQVNDGTNVLGTTAHPEIVAGAGVAGTPAGGVVSIQGVASGTAIPVSGAVTVSGTATVTQGTAAALAAAWPVKVTDGTNTQPTGDAVARSIAVQVNDGTNVLGTTAHPEIVAGAGVAGTPAGGVVSIQGVASGTTIPVTAAQSTAANLLANVGGLGTAGSAPTGNPVYVGGKDPSGNLQAMTVGADKSVLVSQTNNQQLVQTNATVTGNGSATYTGNGFKEANLIINCSGTVTGTNPTLTYTIQEVDPQNTGTVIGTSITGVAIIATGTQTIKLADCTTGALKVSWVIGGTATPTFNAVYTTLSFKPTEDVQEQFAPVAEDNVNGIIAVQFLPLAVATYTPTFSPFVAAVSNAVKASPGNLFGFTATCRTASTTVWFQLFNAIAAPSSGNTAIYQWPIVVGLNPAYIEVGRNLFSESGINFTTGIAYGFSTVKNTYTAATAADCDAAFTFK